MTFVWFLAIQVSGCCQAGQFVVVALCIVVNDALVVVAFCVINIFIASHVIDIVSIIDNKWSMGGGGVGVCLPRL
jgi:steroid 5-alpha reductase family enzyme